MSKEEFRNRYQELCALPNESTPVDKRERGRQLERLLQDVLESEGLRPRRNFRPRGEEVDGSFQIGLHFFLLEAKWHAKPLPASSVSPLRDKVSGRLRGMVGVFVSASGFSPDAEATLSRGSTLNVVLWDRSDLDELFLAERTFQEILEVKLRAVAEEGRILVRSRSDGGSTPGPEPAPELGPDGDLKPDGNDDSKPTVRRSPGIEEALSQMRGDIAKSFLAVAEEDDATPDDVALQVALDELVATAIHALRRGTTWEDARRFEATMGHVGGLVVRVLRADEDLAGDADFWIRQLRLAARRTDNIPPPWELWLLTLRYYVEHLDGPYDRYESLTRIAGLLINATVSVGDWEWD